MLCTLGWVLESYQEFYLSHACHQPCVRTLRGSAESEAWQPPWQWVLTSSRRQRQLMKRWLSLDWNGNSCHELNSFIPVRVKGRPKIACGLDNLLAVTFTSYPSTAVSSLGCWFKELTEIHFPSKKSSSFPPQSCLQNEGATIEPVVMPWPLNYLQALFACQSSSQTSQKSSWKVSLVLDLSERNP